jgi:hypothetical protein
MWTAWFSEAKLFNDMFTDYSNNLKRRYTAGFRLTGQVGIYIPHRQEHYIDATLIFKMISSSVMR